MVALSETAKTMIQRLLADSSDGATGLRIMIEEGGCAGLQYKLGLDTAANDGDEVYDFGDVRLYVDPYTVPIVRGMTIDFVDGVESAGFVFDNPNAAGACSCGKSFSS